MVEELMKELLEKSNSNRDINEIVDDYAELYTVFAQIKSTLDNLRPVIVDSFMQEDSPDQIVVSGNSHKLKISRSKKLEVRSNIPEFEAINNEFNKGEFRNVLNHKVTFTAKNDFAEKILTLLLEKGEEIEYEIDDSWDIDKKEFAKDETSAKKLQGVVSSNPSYRITQTK